MRTIKVLGEMLGWTKTVKFNRIDGNVDEERFCDLMMSHTARRSFASNAYIAGIPPSSIMAVT